MVSTAGNSAAIVCTILCIACTPPFLHAGTVDTFTKNGALLTSGNYSGGTPTGTSDVVLASSTTTLTISAGTLVAESMNVTNGSSYTIGNATGTATSSTLKLGNSAGFTDAVNSVANDLFYLTGSSSLAIQGVNTGTGTGTLSIALQSSGNLDVADGGSTLTINSAVTGAFGLNKTGAGTLVFNNATGFSGVFTASAGTTYLNTSGALGGASAVSVASGATLTSSYTGLTNAINSAAALTDNGNIDVSGSAQTVASLAGTNTGAFLTIGKYSSVNGSFTVGDGTTTAFAGVIRDGGTAAGTGTGTFTKQGSGKLTLTGTNTFTGTVNVSAGTLAAACSSGAALGSVAGVNVGIGGTLLLGAANQANSSGRVALGTAAGTAAAVINAAAFSQGSTASQGLGALTLKATASADFGSGSSSTILHFGDSSGNTWTSGTVLSILNYAGIVDDSNGVPIVGTTNADGLLFGSAITGLTAAQVAQLQFINPVGADGTVYTGSFGAVISANGQVFAEVPEPATILAGLLMVGALGWNQRRRLDGLAGSLRTCWTA